MTRPQWWAQVLADLRRHEGCRLSAYKDSVGVWTVGYGHTGSDVKPGLQINQGEADYLLEKDLQEAYEDLRIIVPDLKSHDLVRQGVLVNMCFNLGASSLKEFRTTLRNIRDHKYQEAALRMIGTKWATQVKQRAVELCKRMASGKIQPEHQVKNA